MIFSVRSPGSDSGGRFMNNSIKLNQCKKDNLGARFKKQNTNANTINNNNPQQLQNQQNQDQQSFGNAQGILPQQQQLNKSDSIEDNEEDEWNEEQNEKLNQIVSRMKKMKEEKRVKDLVLNLPSRMLKKLDQNKFQLLNDKSYFYDENTYIPLIQEFEEQEKAKENHNIFMNSIKEKTPNQNKPKNIQNISNTNQEYHPMSNNSNNPIIESIPHNLNSSSSNNHNNHIPICENPESIKEVETIHFNQFNQLDQLKNVSQPMNNQSIPERVTEDPSKKFLSTASLTSQQRVLPLHHFESIRQSSKKQLSFKNNAKQHKRNWLFNLQNGFSQKTKIIYRFLEKTMDKIPVLHPSSPEKFTWDFINVATIMISMFYLPITIIFDFAFSAVLATPFILIIPNVLVIDVLVNLNTGYFEKGQVIKSRMRIAKNYGNKNLLTDIVSVMPFIFALYADTVYHSGEADVDSQNYLNSFASTGAMNVLKLLFFLKIRAFSQILKRIEERFTLSHQLTNLLQLIKLLVTIVMINHLFACIWVYTAKLEHEANFKKTWMTHINIKDESWENKYLNAYYFTTVTMITVGYGDILPKNDVEMVLCVITMMLACCVFGYTLNEVGAIFSSFFKIGNEIKMKISIIQRFMSKKGINQKLQYQIREYLEYYWRESAEMNSEQEQVIIDQLSESLKSNLLFEANKIVLKDSSIFKGNFSKLVIEQTVPLINEIKYSPESLICAENIQDDQSIFFIENGSVDVILDAKQKNPTPLQTLQKGECFGAYTFFTGLPRNTNVRSREFTTILKIRRSDFLALVQNHTEDHETFNDIKDKINYLNDYTKIGLNCQACKSSRHVLANCQYLHYVPNKQRVINRYNETMNLQRMARESYIRRYQSDPLHPSESINPYRNTLLISFTIQEQAEEFRVDKLEEDGSEADETQYSIGYYNAEEELNGAEDFFPDDQEISGVEDGILIPKNIIASGQESVLKGSKSKQGMTSSTTADVTTANCHDTIEEALDEGETILEVKQQQELSSDFNIKHKSLALEKLLSRPLTNEKVVGQEEQFLRESKKQQESISDKDNRSVENILVPHSIPQKQQKIGFKDEQNPPADMSKPSSMKKPIQQKFTSLAQLGGLATVIQSLGAKSAARRAADRLKGLKAASKNENQLKNSPKNSLLARLQASGLKKQPSQDEENRNKGNQGATHSTSTLKAAMRRIVNAQRVLDITQLNPIEKKIQRVLLGQGHQDQSQNRYNRKLSSENMKSNKFPSQALGKKPAEPISNETLMALMQQLLAQTQQRNQFEESFRTDSFINNNNNINNTNSNPMNYYNKQDEDCYDIFLHFDKQKSFTKYNPRFNYTSVISRLNQILDIARKKMKSKKERNSKIKGMLGIKGLDVPQLDSRKISKFSPSGTTNLSRTSLKYGYAESQSNSIERLPQSQQMQQLLMKEKEQEKEQSQMQLQFLQGNNNGSFGEADQIIDFAGTQRKELKRDITANSSVLGLNETMNQQVQQNSPNIFTARDNLGSENRMNNAGNSGENSSKDNNIFNFSMNNCDNGRNQLQQYQQQHQQEQDDSLIESPGVSSILPPYQNLRPSNLLERQINDK